MTPWPFVAGETWESTLLLDAGRVRAFADAVGDHNPIHHDAAFAAHTRFGRPIVHGTYLLGLVGKIMGMDFPRPGTIYLSHTVQFRRPIYVGSSARFIVTVRQAWPETRRLLVATQVLDQTGATCMDGEALLWRPE